MLLSPVEVKLARQAAARTSLPGRAPVSLPCSKIGTPETMVTIAIHPLHQAPPAGRQVEDHLRVRAGAAPRSR